MTRNRRDAGRRGTIRPDSPLNGNAVATTDSRPPSQSYPADESLVSVISWKGVALGSLTAFAISIALGLITAEALETNLGARASMTFGAMFVGGFVAGKVAGRMGVIQGVAIAVVFILIGASIKAYVEIDLASRFGPAVLGPMDMGGLILGDLVHLLGGCAGGWFADSLNARSARAPAPRPTPHDVDPDGAPTVGD